MSIRARNWFPWNVQFDQVSFKPMGEFTSALKNLTAAPMPVHMAFLEKKLLTISFTVADELFCREYASAYTNDEDAASDASLERFIHDVGFVFSSDDIPTHEAHCLNWE